MNCKSVLEFSTVLNFAMMFQRIVEQLLSNLGGRCWKLKQRTNRLITYADFESTCDLVFYRAINCS